MPVLAQGAQGDVEHTLGHNIINSNSALRGLPERQGEKRDTRADVLLDEDWRRRAEGGGEGRAEAARCRKGEGETESE